MHQESATNNKPFLTEKEAAEYIALAPATLRRWRCVGRGPSWHRLSTSGRRGRIVYARADLEAWIAACRQETPGNDTQPNRK